MDRLVAEAEKKISEKSTQKAQEFKQKSGQNSTKTEQIVQKSEENSQNLDKSGQNAPFSYVNSFENLTVADIKRQEEEKKQEEFKKEKEVLIEKQFEEPKQQIEEPENETKSENIIEKPNYDLIEENPKVVKISTKKKSQKRLTKRAAAIALSLALGATGIITVANVIVIDQMQSSFSEIESTYNLKLRKYLQNITELDGTKMGSEVIETYPDETKSAGDLGTKSNWFDRLCNFIARLFGG